MAAQNGTLTLVGKSGRTYIVDIYIPDATATQLTFNPSGIAASTSPSTLRVPEDCVIYDISGAAPTAVGATIYNNSGAVVGGAFRWANQLATLANRQKMKIPLRAGDIISAVQF